jgi:hypothetical protein
MVLLICHLLTEGMVLGTCADAIIERETRKRIALFMPIPGV